MISISSLDRIELEDAALECGLYDAYELADLADWQLEQALSAHREECQALAYFDSFYSY